VLSAFIRPVCNGPLLFGRIWHLLSDGVQAFIADDALSRGASISFYTITSIGPVLFIVVAIAGLAFGEDAARGAIAVQLRDLMGRPLRPRTDRGRTSDDLARARGHHWFAARDSGALARVLTGDDPAQLERARRLFEAETIFLPKTVVLETEWVLRSLYGLSSRDIVGALSALVALPQVRCEDTAAISAALELMRRNLDFADALHIASSGAAQRFATFDRKLMRRAKLAATRIAVSAP